MSDEIEAIKESAKATQEVAKATGKGIDAVQSVGKFVSKIVGGTLEQGMGIWEDKLKYKRFENQLEYINKISQKQKALGLTNQNARPISMKLGIPLIEAASLEENEKLRELWANLTINSINEDSAFTLERAFIVVLEQITEVEAEILKKIYSHQRYDRTLNNSIETVDLPHSIVCTTKKTDLVQSFKDGLDGVEKPPPRKILEPSTEVQLALSNLSRLQCVKLAATFGEEGFGIIHPTIFGERLFDAVTLLVPSD